MASTITADNGTVSGSAGLKQSADSSGILALATGSGTTAVTIDATQNVGIGTSSPSADSSLHVFAATDKARISVQRNGVSKAYMAQDGGGDFYLWNEANANIRFYNNNTERARIDSSGRLILGGTVADSGCWQTITYNGGSGANGIGINETSGQSGATFAVFTTGVLGSTASNIGTITRVGATSAVIYNTSSDYRLKTVIGPVSGYKERINALEPIEFEWKEDGTRTRGFLAHKFQEAYAHSVTGEKDAVDSYGNPVYQAMQAGTSEVIADLVALLQEQQALITTLTERITALEAK